MKLCLLIDIKCNAMIIDAKNITKKYGKNEILSSLFFSIDKLENVAIVGPNGSGKTTLLNILSLNDRKFSGDLETTLKPEDISFQVQTSNYPNNFTVYEIMYMFTKKDNDISIKEKIIEQLKEFSLEGHLNSYPSNLSGGQLQKLNILLTFASNPKVVFFDELLSGLDQQTIEQVLLFIKKKIKEKGMTTITVSHNPEEIFNISDKVMFLENGSFKEVVNISDFEDVKALSSKMKSAIVGNLNGYEYDKLFLKKNDVVFDVDGGLNAIEVQNIRKSYKMLEVLKGVRSEGIKLEIKNNQRLAIIGRNGSGKSTLAEIISGTKSADYGKVKISLIDKEKLDSLNGKILTTQNEIDVLLKERNKLKETDEIENLNKKIRDLTKLRDSYEKSIEKAKLKNSKNRGRFSGIQFQKQLYPSMLNLRDIVIFILNANGIKYKEDYIDYVLNTVGLLPMKYSKSHELSGGERQKLNIILTLIKSPHILILDELTTGLDINSQELILKIVKDYMKKENPNLILVTHSINDIIELADRVILLKDGEIKEDLLVKGNLPKIKKIIKE